MTDGCGITMKQVNKLENILEMNQNPQTPVNTQLKPFEIDYQGGVVFFLNQVPYLLGQFWPQLGQYLRAELHWPPPPWMELMMVGSWSSSCTPAWVAEGTNMSRQTALKLIWIQLPCKSKQLNSCKHQGPRTERFFSIQRSGVPPSNSNAHTIHVKRCFEL